MIATSAVMANYLLVTYITPLAPGDDDYAFCAVLPANAEGLRIYPRRPYAPMATSVYDYPLSSRFDEIDTMLVLRDVFVPWEHVFIYRNVDIVNAQWHETPAHLLVNFHTLVRFCVKMEFVAGLASTRRAARNPRAAARPGAARRRDRSGRARRSTPSPTPPRRFRSSGTAWRAPTPCTSTRP